ncbi:MAG: alcohol dehydrogenase catalytic domain-containing protein [Streptosporangiales bacterium]|nr:alcohol dehydrogenase catalytic domain-containing protein [Streptosporangiales bacterium]
MSVKRVLVSGPEDFAVEEVPDPRPAPGEVLLRLVSAGICGTDLALLRGQNAVARYPVVLGHECVAQVVSVPEGPDPDAAGLRAGEHVVVFPTISCGSCRACREGRDNQCPTMRVMGLSDPNGCFTELLTVAPSQCVPIPSEVARTYGALVEPMAVASHLVGRSAIGTQDDVAVIGSGMIGLATGLAARARGVGRLLAVDRFPSREPVARRLGFDDFTAAGGGALASWIAERGGVDVVFDTVMTAETTTVAIDALRPGGRYVAVASAKPGARLMVRYDDFYRKELTVVGCRNYTREDFRAAADLLARGLVDPRPLVTANLELGRFGEAMTALAERPDRHLKVLLHPSEVGGSSPAAGPVPS